MGKKNLELELGGKYVSEMFHNALFTHDNKLCRLRFCDDKKVLVQYTDLDNPRDVWEEMYLPTDILHGFSKFQWPTLGYRQIETENGFAVIHMTAVRSAHRGLRHEHLHYEYLPVTMRLRQLLNVWEALPSSLAMAQVFKPKFIKFTEGLKMLLAGQTAAFAVSPHLAVCISVDQSAESAYDIYFRQKLVGTISETGEVSLHNKIVQRDTVRAALFG